MRIFFSHKTISQRQSSAGVWLVFAISLAIIALTFKGFFPIQDGWLGHDYKQALPGWLDGYIWFTKNGLSVPWFTPSFCAGQPFFADQAASYYSLPQLLYIVTDPIVAPWMTLCLAVSSMFWGGYLLMRRGFMTGPLAALLVGGMLMFNGFIPHRIIIGHVTYHGFALVPWLALLLIIPLHSRVNTIAAASLAGAMLAYFVHSGLSSLVLAAALSILIVGLMHCLLGGSLRHFLTRSVLAGLVGISLSAAKLMATFSFLAFFPRTAYLLPGIPSALDTVAAVLRALFTESQKSHDFGAGLLVNQEFILGPQEWAYNFSAGGAVLLLALMVNRLATRFRQRLPLARPATSKMLIGLVLVICLIWPLAFNYYSPDWNALLKSIPILSSTSTALRWIVVYVPMIAVCTGLLLERSSWRNFKLVAVLFCLIATATQSVQEYRRYYYQPDYYSGPVMEAHRQLKEDRFRAGITELGVQTSIQSGDITLRATINNTLVAGMSQLECYSPAFGYRREGFSSKGLITGPVLVARDGLLNLKNPACYVYPEENNCKPGDHFRSDQLEEARKFVNYKPFAFNFSAAQKWANWLTQIAMGFTLLVFVAWGYSKLRLKLGRLRIADLQDRRKTRM